ncbi:MAG: hypothetical protein IT285_00450 [Bdellovibrionales bacterium]|nr:hypothetical protein [Bdellovibrionales bacterium]
MGCLRLKAAICWISSAALTRSFAVSASARFRSCSRNALSSAERRSRGSSFCSSPRRNGRSPLNTDDKSATGTPEAEQITSIVAPSRSFRNLNHSRRKSR